MAKTTVLSLYDFTGYSVRPWAKLGGKSEKTKEIRSATPRGFAKAVFEANSRQPTELLL